MATADKATAIEIMLKIKKKYPDISLPIQLQPVTEERRKSLKTAIWRFDKPRIWLIYSGFVSRKLTHGGGFRLCSREFYSPDTKNNLIITRCN